MTTSQRSLPSDHRTLALLARTASSEVHHALGPAGEVALRIAAPDAGAPGRAELAVLAAVDHPGLARLVGFGRVPSSGDLWLARRWVAGQDLRAWYAGADGEALGALVAQLCLALQHLHERGFVHADVKPENILVDASGAPSLTDFGLARERGTVQGTAGSLFYVAPEVLAGASPERAADLFALGVTLHALLLSPVVSASEFYGRFPGQDYFTATGTQASDLPAWARGIVTQLLERNPARRPASAAAVGAALRARLGLRATVEVEDLRHRVPRWSPLAGREDWLGETLAVLDQPVHLRLPAGEDELAFARALQLWMSLHGEHATVLELERTGTAGMDLDRQAEQILESHPDGLLLVPVAVGDHDAWRRLAYLMRCLQQRAQAPGPGASGLILLGSEEAPPGAPAMRVAGVPVLNAATLTDLLQVDIEGDTSSLMEVLLSASKGALEFARAALQRGFAAGDFIHGESRATLRPAAQPERWSVAENIDLQRVSAAQLEFVGALDVLGGHAPAESLREVLDVATESFDDTLQSCVEARLVCWRRTGRGPARIELLAPVAEADLESLGREVLQALHARCAQQLEREAGSELAFLLQRYAARPSSESFGDVLDAMQTITEAWQPALALGAAEQLERFALRFDAPRAPRATAEVAVGWARLGQLDRAEQCLDGLDLGDGAPASARAALARARGVIAHERHDFEQAAEHLRRAREWSVEDGGDSLCRQAMLAFDRRADQELDAVCAEADASVHPLRSWNLWNLQALRGLSLCRRGRLEEGVEQLQALLRGALNTNDEAREARARLNLATVLRRGGQVASALEHLRRAAAINAQLNHLPALAQTRAMLGGTLRAEGNLLEAEGCLRSACVLRERLGDESGANAARGMLGLVHADRGMLRAGLDELVDSARALRAAQRSADAVLLEASALELEARVTGLRPNKRLTQEPAPDPRVLLLHARAEALWGGSARATDYAQRALELATKLALDGSRAEAAFLLEALGEQRFPEELHGGATPRLFAQRAVWQWLIQTPDQFQDAAALQTARSFATDGFMDLAARLAMAVLARVDEGPAAQEALALAREWLEQVEPGLSSEQSVRARRTLLGLPDPHTADIDFFERALAEGGAMDMDIISLLDINQRLVSQDDLKSLLGEIVASALAVTRAERGFLVLEHDGELEFDTARHSRRGDIADPELEVSSSILRQVFEGGTTLRLSNAGDDPLLSGAPSVEQLDLRSILVTPFVVDDSLRGAIYVDHRLKAGAFSERAEQLLELLSSQAALAIRQVRRLEEIRTLNGELSSRVREREQQLASARQALQAAGAALPVANLIGSSEVMQRVHHMIGRAAPASLPVLVHGESGTGKELAAKALHNLSERASGAFVVENCAALPAALIESELFGYMKGAFTGANNDRAGIFERADGGTLFLDEIGELPIELQAKLLRVLETGEVRRVGGSRLIRTDFRLVAATNRNLSAEVVAGRFRADLMYRLDALCIEMPTLAQHVEDIPELIEHFLRLNAEPGEAPRRITRPVLAAFMRRDWPGNVRELANEVARMCVLSEGDLADPGLLRAPAARATTPGLVLQAAGEIIPIALVERQAIENALRETGGDKRLAATKLGISRAKLYQRLKEWGAEGQAGA